MFISNCNLNLIVYVLFKGNVIKVIKIGASSVASSDEHRKSNYIIHTHILHITTNILCSNRHINEKIILLETNILTY